MEQVIAATLSARAPFAHEYRIVWPDGSVHWIASRGEAAHDEAGRPVRLSGAAFNIDDRKRAEAALRQSEVRLRQAVRVSGIGIFDHDHLGDTVYWSPDQRAIHVYDPESPVTLDVYYSRVHPEDREGIAAQVRRAHDPAGDGLFDVEHRLILPDGSVRWTSTRSQTLFAGQGEGRHPVRTIGAATDITERKRSEDELKKLASAVEMSNEFIGIATLEGNVLYLNKAALSLVGIESVEEARRKTIFEFFPESNRAQAAEDLYPALMTRGLWAGESRLRHFQIRDEPGVSLYLATVSRDIRERKKAAAERAKLEASLLQAQKMESIGRLAGGVAHDFNNMLTVVLGFASLAKKPELPPGMLRNYLDEIEKAGERSRQITRQLLGFSRQQIIAPGPCDLNLIVDDLKNPLARLIGEDVELLIYAEPCHWKTLLDSSQINQTLLNLATNARDAMPYGGRLTIETANVRVSGEYARTQANSAPGDYVVVAVSDNGRGMSRETQAHAFEPFFTTKESGKGTGLGLATVYGIVKQNGGFINVYSEFDRGTTFRIYFPRLAAADESKEPVLAPAPSGRGRLL